ncbi:MAG: glycosyltransferase family 4 protein [Methylococcaceae bacterium]|jgi:GalNAc-alpha-(1->4)-GalNAc-alpha-(1->3)-diNAcBac-PP-undecaprenol alpha-1,4-N-acetyl-D-galactosaminyltransferase
MANGDKPILRLLFVAPSLGAGGAERVLSILANAFDARGDQVTVVTLATPETDFYSLNPQVGRISLAGMQDSATVFQAIANNVRRLLAIRRALAGSHANVVISLCDQTNILVLLATLGLGLNIIATEHTDPRHRRLGSAWALLRRLTYPWASRVVMLTEPTLAWACKQWPRWRATVIPNPVHIDTPERLPARPVFFADHTVVTLGRLHPLKGHRALIRSFSRIAQRYADWRLVIFGEGPERAVLEEQIAELGLEHRVYLPGTVDPSASVLLHADLFVLSSRYEGFPMALLEAMALGRPCVSFDCPSGPAAIIDSGVNGILVPPGDEAALADAMASLMNNPAERARIGRNARAVSERFGLERIMNQWDQLMGECLAESEKTRKNTGEGHGR